MRVLVAYCSATKALFAHAVHRALAASRLAGVGSAVAEGSVPYDPQTNGAAEIAVTSIKVSIPHHAIGS